MPVRGEQPGHMPSRPKARPAGLGARYWGLWGAATVSGLGDGLVLVAFPLLVASLTREPQWVAGVIVAQRLPWLLLSLHAGALADRLDRRRVLAFVEVARMLVLLLLGAVVATGHLNLAVIYGSAAALGGLETLFSAASHATLPTLVPASGLTRANGYLQAGQMSGAQFVGPAVGGLLFAAAAALPFVADGVSFAASAALLVLALPRPKAVAVEAPPRVTSVGADVVAGVRWFVGNPLLRLLAVTVAALAFCWAMVNSVLVLYGLEVLHLSRGGYGVFLAVTAAGEVLGGIVAGRVHARFGTTVVVLGGALLAAAAYLVVGLSSMLVVATVALAAEALGIGVANVATMSLRQNAVPPELLGRVGNAFRMCLAGAMPLGALVGGLLAQASLRGPFIAAAVIQLALVALCGPALARRVAEAESPAVAVAVDDPALQLVG
jgi:MFS family permease